MMLFIGLFLQHTIPRSNMYAHAFNVLGASATKVRLSVISMRVAPAHSSNDPCYPIKRQESWICMTLSFAGTTFAERIKHSCNLYITDLRYCQRYLHKEKEVQVRMGWGSCVVRIVPWRNRLNTLSSYERKGTKITLDILVEECNSQANVLPKVVWLIPAAKHTHGSVRLVVVSYLRTTG